MANAETRHLVVFHGAKARIASYLIVGADGEKDALERALNHDEFVSSIRTDGRHDMMADVEDVDQQFEIHTIGAGNRNAPRVVPLDEAESMGLMEAR